MLFNSLKATGGGIARLAIRQNGVTLRRTFITPTAVRQADLVQDMYLRELKNYKPAAVKASDSEGQVQKFRLPTAPQSPEEADIANELKAYEQQQVELEGQSGEPGSAPVEEDWFEEEAAEEEAAHGH
ncbi:hypothetical protein K461DRAFT_288831 [Myriangium duriaei CBS 260.36]|uniref:Uncharacterized protein n=1 Tax=Myriangium duriaei CBS 260.36 TaxID=1168546 RepID=A0A9P4MCE5_9PEZI|nr:hypothetical protein K461DRAFT_288831 [Myriangium duriaei CBS 260.36]